jgi:hypothetical protein
MKGYKMKKILFVVATMAMMSNVSYASKARMSALANTAALTDTQSIFSNAADVNFVPEFATFEMGEKAGSAAAVVDATPNAEGGFLQSSGDAKWGFYLGKLESSTNGARAGLFTGSVNASVTAGSFLMQENPINVYYGSKAGDMGWGVGFNYSSSDKKATDQKQSLMGLSLGAKTDVWGAYANIGLGSTSQTGNYKYTGKQGLVLAGSYNVDSMKFYGKQEMFGYDVKNSSTLVTNDSSAITTVGMTNKWKQDASVVFYGVAYQMTTLNTDSGTAKVKVEKTALPVHIGMEVDAASWVTLRGSVSQNLMLGSSKSTVTTSSTSTTTGPDTISQNTTTAAGMGLKFAKSNLDFVMSNTATTGILDFDQLGASASYTYLF